MPGYIPNKGSSSSRKKTRYRNKGKDSSSSGRSRSRGSPIEDSSPGNKRELSYAQEIKVYREEFDKLKKK